MTARYRAWMNAHTELRGRLDAGDLSSAREGVDRLRGMALDVALDGLDLAAVCNVMGKLFEVDLLRLERRFGEAEDLLDRIIIEGTLDLNQVGYLRANLLVARGNLALVQNALESATERFREAIEAAPADQLLVLGNAWFQFGSSLTALSSETDEDTLVDEADAAYRQSLRCYEALGLRSKVADCLHMMGNLERFRGRFEAAVDRHLRALEIYKSLDDARGCWMSADDASRAMYWRAMELDGTPECEQWLAQALNISGVATVFSNRVWRSAADSELLRRQLSVQLETHLVNRIDVAVATAPALIHAALAHHKGRIRATRPDTIEMICHLARDEETRAAIREEISPALFETLASGLQRLLVSGQRVAILDQWCLRGRTLITAITYIDHSGIRLDAVRSTLDRSVPDRDPADEPRFFGGGRANPAQPVIDRLIENIRRGGDRAMMYLGENAIPATDEQRDQLRVWAGELTLDAALLGSWFFSPQLLELLKESAIDHVVVIPDPYYLGVPYLMLESDGAPIAMQPWSLSITGSLVDLGCIAARYEDAVPPEKLTWFGPDRDVNENRGGNSERTALAEFLDLNVVGGESATVEAARAAIADGGWLHFRGHGRWDVPNEARGLVCANGVLRAADLHSFPHPHGAVLVTIACATGFADVVGTESFGPLSEYDTAGLRSALLTLWPISGDAGTPYSVQLYRVLAQGNPIASAYASACRAMREQCPHPFFWACFALVGSWSTRLPWAGDRPADLRR
jgi:tetratricopeptide (TPR) repeat protein